MTRAAYIGGTANGQMSAEGVGNALTASGHYEDADVFTESYAAQHPEEVARAVKDVDTFTHSAGFVALKDTKPKEIIGAGAPLPTTPSRLLLHTGEKTVKMLGHQFTSPEAFVAVSKYNASAIAEVARLIRHPITSSRRLKEIAAFDSIEAGGAAVEAGIPVWLFYNERDVYFNPTDEQKTLAGVLGVELHMIPGQHDQLPLYPAQTLQQINSRR